MLLSYSHSFIFFHVAKVAGISIREALAPYTQEPERFRVRRPPREINGQPNRLYEMWASTLVHATVAQTQCALPHEFDHFFKFAFVRNPWDWQVSMYHFLLREKENPAYEKVSALGSFDKYLEWVVQEQSPYPKGATKLQKTMLIDNNGDLGIDKVGRFENLHEEFANITQKIGISARLPKLNVSHHKRYIEYYNTRTKNLVATHFAEDIELFKYTFQ